MAVQHDAGAVVTGPRDHAGDAPVVGLAALLQDALRAEPHHRARVDLLRASDGEVLRAIRIGELDVTCFGSHADVARDFHVAFKQPSKSATFPVDTNACAVVIRSRHAGMDVGGTGPDYS